MISETTFVDCDGLPDEMRRRLDEPWSFVGEVKAELRLLRALCHRCNDGTFSCIAETRPRDEPVAILDMNGRTFITDDMIEVIVFFGVCQKCDSVHWARSGPPFRRARAIAAAH